MGIKNVSENVRKTQENYPMRAQGENIFLYYTLHWVKTLAACVRSHGFAHVFGHKPYQNANPTQSVLRA